jgi:multiple sugar transport system ATP-binding protein
MRAEIARVQKRIGVAALYVTHDQTEAMTLGQRVTVMDHGVVQQTDAPKKLYDWPTNTFVASFIGSPPMNFVRGTLDSGCVDLGGIVVALPEGRLNQLSAERREMTAGLRPESFVAADGDSTDRSTIRGQVEVVEQLGSESFVYFRTEGLEVLEIGDRPVELRGALCAKLPASIEYEPGDRIDLSVRAELLRLFEPDSGQAILSK